MANIAVYKNILSDERPEISVDKKFPANISGWTSKNVSYDKAVLDVLKPDITIYRQYEKAALIPVTLFAAYYNSAEKSDLSHSPIVCFTGQGWEILSSSKKSIPLGTPDEAAIRINRIEQKQLQTYMVTYYWYQASQNAYSNRGIMKISLLMNKLVGKNENNAFIRLTVQGQTKMQLENAERAMERFVKDLYPTLRLFLS